MSSGHREEHLSTKNPNASSVGGMLKAGGSECTNIYCSDAMAGYLWGNNYFPGPGTRTSSRDMDYE